MEQKWKDRNIMEMNTIFDITKDEIVFIYNSNKFRDREAYGYIQSVHDYKVRDIDISKEELTETQLMDVCDRLGVQPSQLMDIHSDVYVNSYKGKDLDKESILKAVKNNPSLLNTPITLYWKEGYFVKTPYDLVKKGMTPKGINTESR